MNFEQYGELSAVMFDMTIALNSAINQLSSIPQHPYYATKEILFGKDHKFPILDDVDVPEQITTEGMIAKLVQIEENYQTTLIDTITNPDDYNIQAPSKHLSILAELSGDDTYVVTEDRYKNYIEFLELTQSIDINSVTPDNSVEMIRKLGYFYTNCLNKKTIK